MTIKLDVLLVQIIHVLVLFWMFRKIIGDSLTTALLERKATISKLANADAAYAEKIAQAKEETDAMIKEWLARKDTLIAEWTQLAQKKYDSIVADGEQKATRFLEDAQQKAGRLEKELQDGFLDGVKHTTQLVVNKLFAKDVSLQESYVETLVKEFGVK